MEATNTLTLLLLWEQSQISPGDPSLKFSSKDKVSKWYLWSQVTLCMVPKGLPCPSLLHMFSLQLILPPNSSQPLVTCVLLHSVSCCSLSCNRPLGNQHQLLQNTTIFYSCSNSGSSSSLQNAVLTLLSILKRKITQDGGAVATVKTLTGEESCFETWGLPVERYFLKFLNTKPGQC